MFKHKNRRGGFTLPEVLVTVAIVAVLAAAVVPTVVNQLGKGEGASVAADINALTQAVTQFIADTRQYPDDLDHLNTAIATTLMTDIYGDPYSQRAVNAWAGPYLATTMAADAGFTFSGFGLVADDELLGPAGHDGFITLSLTGTTSAERIAAIDAAIDGGDGAFDTDCTAPPAVTSGKATGRLRWTEAADAQCTVSAIVFRLVPTGG